MSKHNGWASFETWQAALWLSEADTLGRLEEDGFDSVDAETLESIVLEMLPESPVGLLGDVVNSWLSCVNFHEIADTFTKDLEG